MSWSPIPGTIPALAVEHLRKCPANTRLPTAVLADAIGHDSTTLSAYLAVARDMEWLCNQRIPMQRMSEWWLGPAAPPPFESPGQRFRDVEGPPAAFEEARPEVAPDRKLAPTPQPEKSEVPDMYQELADLAEQSMVCAAPGTEIPIGLIESTDVPVIVRMPSAACTGPAPARWGVFSDGGFMIEKAGQKVEIERVEFESLLSFLERMVQEDAA